MSGATVFIYVGNQPPTSARDWNFECNTSRSKLLVNFPSSNPPAAKVWFAAVWFNGRHETGPVSSPISSNLPGGSVAMAAWGEMAPRHFTGAVGEFAFHV